MTRTTLQAALKRANLRAALALALLAPAAAFAQHFEAVDNIPWPTLGRFPAYPLEPARPTEIYVRAGVLRDNNVFRFADGVDRRALLGNSNNPADEVLRVGAGIRHEFLVTGRQRLRLTASGDQYSYHNNTLLNHVNYALRGEWLWEFTNDLSGAVGYERRQRLADLAQLQRPVKDMITEDHAFVNGAYRLGPSIRLRGAVDGVKGSRSDAAFASADTRAVTVLGGVDYVTTLGNAFGVEVRNTEGNYPTAQILGGTTLVDNEFTEREVAAVTTIVAGAQITGTARLGHTNRKHKQFPERNFSGTTWRGTLLWTPLQKTGFEFSLYHEPRSIIDIAASSVVVNGASFGPRWAPTEKLVFYALVVRERQQFQGDPSQIVLGTPQQDEIVRVTRFGVGWEPRRFIELSAAIDHGNRVSNVFLRDYTYTAVMANAQFKF
jgi:hypothetical protein